LATKRTDGLPTDRMKRTKASAEKMEMRLLLLVPLNYLNLTIVLKSEVVSYPLRDVTGCNYLRPDSGRSPSGNIGHCVKLG
jgi:hypothetical protein